MIDVVNLQRKITIDVAAIRSYTQLLAEEVSEANGRRFSVAFISDGRMKQLTTDVLSFPHEPDEFDPDKDNLGDIVISVEQAQKQAAENGLTLEGEIKQLILHGLLHLCGYDHETDDGVMNELELVLRVQLAIQ